MDIFGFTRRDLMRAALAAPLPLLLPGAGKSEEAKKTISYVRAASASDIDAHAVFGWEVLAAVLEKTRPTYGDYSLTVSPDPAQALRFRHVTKSSDIQVNVVILTISPEWNDSLGRSGRLRRRNWRSRRSQRRNAVGERWRRRFARRMTTDRVAQRCEAPVFGGERRIVAHLALELERGYGVKFAVEGSIESQKPLVHVLVGHASALKVLASMARARASRDITVPTGVSVASAISR